MNPAFYDRAVDTGEPGEDGRPTYRVVPYFLFQVDANNTVDRAARDEDRERFPEAWAAFERARQPAVDGFPLLAWTGIGPAERQGLADRGLFTLEALAAADLTKAPADLKEAKVRAAAFLKRTGEEAPKLAARIAELEGENETLCEQVADMRAAVEELKRQVPERHVQAGGQAAAGRR